MRYLFVLPNLVILLDLTICPRISPIAAIQVDYDLSFPEASYSSAALSVPFRFDGGRQSFTIAMWVQFSHRDEPGVFFTLYSVTYVIFKRFLQFQLFQIRY